MPKQKLRIVLAKPGLDGHDRGVKIVARALRDAGHEVIYTGLQQTAEQIVQTAIEEDADAVGLSVLSGAHLTHFKAVIEEFARRDASDVVVFGGGIIPDEDVSLLREMGEQRSSPPDRRQQRSQAGSKSTFPAAHSRVGRVVDERLESRVSMSEFFAGGIRRLPRSSGGFESCPSTVHIGPVSLGAGRVS